MNKNILITVAISVFLAIIVFSILIIIKKPAPESAILINTIPYQSDETELNSIEKDLAALNEDENLFAEIDQTYGDILDMDESALDEDSISKEGMATDFSEDLKSFNDDETALQELDQAFVEIMQ